MEGSIWPQLIYYYVMCQLGSELAADAVLSSGIMQSKERGMIPALDVFLRVKK